MKKWLSILLAMLLAVSLCAPAMADEEDSRKFIEEHEAENGSLDNSGLYLVPEMDLPDWVPFEYEDFDDVVELLTEETGVLYLGFPRCPWCRAIIPAMIDAWEMSGSTEEISYFSPVVPEDLRPKRSLDEEGNVIEEKPGSPEYVKLVELLNEHLRPYSGAKDESIKHIYFPMVVFVREGNIEYAHIGTVDGHDRGETMTQEEYDGLVALLAEHMSDLLQDCDD